MNSRFVWQLLCARQPLVPFGTPHLELCRWAFQLFFTRGQDKEVWTNKSARQWDKLPQIFLVHACEENESPDKVLLTLLLKLIYTLSKRLNVRWLQCNCSYCSWCCYSFHRIEGRTLERTWDDAIFAGRSRFSYCRPILANVHGRKPTKIKQKGCKHTNPRLVFVLPTKAMIVSISLLVIAFDLLNKNTRQLTAGYTHATARL
jgi:hypothetical protein